MSIEPPRMKLVSQTGSEEPLPMPDKLCCSQKIQNGLRESRCDLGATFWELDGRQEKKEQVGSEIPTILVHRGKD